MPQELNALVWIDLEMTGLSPERDRIIEIATVITDSNLQILAQGPVIAVHQSKERMSSMDEWNTKTHNRSGLVERVMQSEYDEATAERETLNFVMQHVPRNKSPLCGNSICQDRRFLARYMPDLEGYLHYRNLDVSSVKELALRWRPELVEGHTKRGTHRALDDILESIEELRYYRTHFLRI